MQPSQPSEQEILEQVLVPLLDDFKYWFNRSASLLESERMPFLCVEEQEDLLAKIKTAQDEVRTARTLYYATDKQVGVETKVLMPWHRLVAQCWNVARQWREVKQQES